ncbi:phosphatidylinositol 4-phosphate 3-kinase C2 domain-containing subunit alpha-like [Limulus polyphemus]|uniref:Phosphatidylinositol 4-phosphate 3-kinase C2 domain-containing subunit alpha-like n=1 Tax=Limulus polyphemus TaxID=6850 RepID=A0ABM1BE09_LIMPO|nr:phosphatidylinositol 4-phosphate 3-kinase C2 domain-containing subunit alpha-like [Limulus polyphemus]
MEDLISFSDSSVTEKYNTSNHNSLDFEGFLGSKSNQNLPIQFLSYMPPALTVDCTNLVPTIHGSLQYSWAQLPSFCPQRPSVPPLGAQHLPQIFHHPFHTDTYRFAASNTCSYTMQHSNSTPELANSWISHEDGSKSTYAKDDCPQRQLYSDRNFSKQTSKMNCTEKERHNDLIDLCDVNSEISLFSEVRPSTEDDILELFDPLIVESRHKEKEKDLQVLSKRLLHTSVDTCEQMHNKGYNDKNLADFSSSDSENSEIEEKPKSSFNTTCKEGFSINFSENSNLKNPKEIGSGENIWILKKDNIFSTELITFCAELKQLRSEFTYNDHNTNEGLVISAVLENKHNSSYNVKLEICSELYVGPISFTCDMGTSIEHVISHVVCSIFGDVTDLSVENFILKVHGLAEYLTCDSTLADYEYVHYCRKHDEPVCLQFIEFKDLKHPLARTLQDDTKVLDIKPTNLSLRSSLIVSFKAVNIVMETLKNEVGKLKELAKNLKQDILQPLGVIQAVKAMCLLLFHVETTEISDSLQNLKGFCKTFGQSGCQMDFLLSQEESSSEHTTAVQSMHTVKDNTYMYDQFHQRLELIVNQLYGSVYQLLAMFCQAYEVDFIVESPLALKLKPSGMKDATSILDTLLVHVGSIHCCLPQWESNFDNFSILCTLCHGTQEIASVSTLKPAFVKKSFFDRIVFDEWLEFQTVCLCRLPREAKLYFTLTGIETVNVESRQVEADQKEKIVIGWCGIKLFNFEDELCQGDYLLGFWSDEVKKEMGPTLSNPSSNCPLLQIRFNEFENKVVFPCVIQGDFATTYKDIDHLDFITRKHLLEIVQKDQFTTISQEEKELLWANRHCMCGIPEALPKILQAAHGWDWACLSDIYFLLQEWCPLPPVHALVLLLGQFPDFKVRYTAVQWIKNVGCDELCDYLPQLVQALRFETWDNSPLTWFLLERSLTSVRVTHHLYWLLKQNIDDPLVGRRMQLIMNALLAISGKAMRKLFKNQESLLNSLSDIADQIKDAKDSIRLPTLLQGLESVHHSLVDEPTVLPLSPSLEVCGLDVQCCSYFTSNTLPLKLVFKSPDKGAKSVEAIYKAGDDLRQDMLTIQMIRIMDKIWLKEELDLKIITFTCIPTAVKKGIVEMVTEAETLRKIQTEHGLTGSFKDCSIAEWLQKHSTSELEYQQAVENFTLSCAGYCVATYILGICDRHNDNIMLKTSGHVFHIDFGKFLGDAQTFGNIKRDRTPFILTSDMVYVINGGDKPSEKFQNFIDICCQAFNIIRKQRNTLLNLFSLMAASGIPGVTENAVYYVQNKLLPQFTEARATEKFTRMIEECLKSRFIQFNFFIHSLAQRRFTGDHNDQLLLSFSAKTFTKHTDGCIKSVEMISCQKRYDPEKYYVYELKVTRENVSHSMNVYRTYREFWEFHQKLCMMFPLAKFHPLPRGSFVGRSNIREVAEQRRVEIDLFLKQLLKMAEEIAHCSLVYTFFHPILRDQDGRLTQNVIPRGTNILTQEQESFVGVKSEVKLSIIYKNNSLFVMVMHAKNLRSSKYSAPDSYVKTYLIPDPHKLTKRKTKVVFKSTHPTFMEMLVYGLPLNVVKKRTLHLSVWNFDRVQENAFLGSTTISLEELNLLKENVKWYPLNSVSQ